MRIGIITLHRVLNYGSALQAYALQTYLTKTYGEEVEIIDYIYPNKSHPRKGSVYKKIKGFIRTEIRDRLIYKRGAMIEKFDLFYQKHFKLSELSYDSIPQIENESFQYDLYVTGSDQVWNVKTLDNDPVLYCSFAPKNAKRIAFAASFSLNKLPEGYQSSVRERLLKYSYIGIREKTGIEILNSLKLPSSIICQNTCDPTLLLNQNDYDLLAKESQIAVEGDYIFEYLLNYSFSAEPMASLLINYMKDQTGMKLISLNIKRKRDKNDQLITGIGPCEFVWLIKHAKYVVTSSFHGTIFSIIYRRPFYTIVPDEKHPDRRLSDMLELFGLENRSLKVNGNINPEIVNLTDPFNNEGIDSIDTFVKESKDFLFRAIYGKEEQN